MIWNKKKTYSQTILISLLIVLMSYIVLFASRFFFPVDFVHVLKWNVIVFPSQIFTTYKYLVNKCKVTYILRGKQALRGTRWIHDILHVCICTVVVMPIVTSRGRSWLRFLTIVTSWGGSWPRFLCTWRTFWLVICISISILE